MRIVLVRLSALGDIVHTWPLAEALAVALGNVIANSTLELILRDKKTGEELDPMKMTFGRTVGEVDP